MASTLTLDRLRAMSPAQRGLALQRARHVDKLALLRTLYTGDGSAATGEERVEIVAGLAGKTYVDLPFLMQLANLTGRKPRASAYRDGALRSDGTLSHESYAAAQLAANLSVRAERVFGDNEKATEAVASIPDALAGRLFALLTLREKDAAPGQLVAQDRLLHNRQLSDDFLTAFFDQLERQQQRDASDTLADHTGLSGAALVGRLDDAQIAKLDLAGFTAAQAMLTQTRRDPVTEATTARHRLYAGCPLPQEFWAQMQEGLFALQQRLLELEGEDLDVYLETPGRWAEMEPAEQLGFLQRLADDMADAFRIPRPKLVISGSPEDTEEPLGADGTLAVTHFAMQAPWRATVQLNLSNEAALRRSFTDAVGTVIHEFQHCWQGFIAFGPDGATHMMLSPRMLAQVPAPALTDAATLLLRQVVDANVGMRDGAVYDNSDGTDAADAAYRAQPVEKMAFAFEEKTTPLVMTTLSLLLHGRAPGYLLQLTHSRLAAIRDVLLEHERVEGATEVPSELRRRMNGTLRALGQLPPGTVGERAATPRQAALLQEGAALLNALTPHLDKAVAALGKELPGLTESFKTEQAKTVQLLRLLEDASRHAAEEARRARLAEVPQRLARALRPAPRLPSPVR